MSARETTRPFTQPTNQLKDDGHPGTKKAKQKRHRKRERERNHKAKNAPQSLHNQMLDLVQRQTRLLRDRLEAHRPVIRVPPEHGLDERHQTDLLPQERVVLLQDRLRHIHTHTQTPHARHTNKSRKKKSARTSSGVCSREQTHLLREQRCQRLKLSDIPLVEREQQPLDPLMRRPVQRVQNRVHQLRFPLDRTSKRQI